MEDKHFRYYVSGSAAPEEIPSFTTPPEVREKEREKNRQKVRTRKNRARASYMSLPYTLVVGVAIIALLYGCYSYLQVQSEITRERKSIASLEQELVTLQSDNSSIQTRIDTYLDLDYIYQVATEELGMVYPSSDQVIYFDKTESEYVRQNEDIPND